MLFPEGCWGYHFGGGNSFASNIRNWSLLYTREIKVRTSKDLARCTKPLLKTNIVNPISEQVPATSVRDRGDVEGHPSDLRRLQVECRTPQEGYRLRQDSRQGVLSRNREEREVLTPLISENVIFFTRMLLPPIGMHSLVAILPSSPPISRTHIEVLNKREMSL